MAPCLSSALVQRSHFVTLNRRRDNLLFGILSRMLHLVLMITLLLYTVHLFL
uniref:Uncharacterized protein n=1 Tax=Arundo donax TaxID=35708 RepID=A0A0A9RFX1_ARUDO